MTVKVEQFAYFKAKGLGHGEKMIAERLEICKENPYVCLLKNQSKFKTGLISD